MPRRSSSTTASPAAARESVAATVCRRRRRAARQRHAQRLGGTGHGVGGVHAAAGALARADGPLDGVDVLARYQAASARADRLERVDDRYLALAAVGQLGATRKDCARVEEHRRQIQSRRGHQHPGQRFVTPGQQHRSVQPFGLHDGFHAVGDQFTRRQREVHALVAHRDAVGHRNRAELQRIAARGEHPLLCRLGQPVQRQVAGRDLVPRRGHSDLGLGEVVVVHAYRPQHATCGGLLQAVGDLTAAGFDIDGGRRIGGMGHCLSMRGVPWCPQINFYTPAGYRICWREADLPGAASRSLNLALRMVLTPAVTPRSTPRCWR